MFIHNIELWWLSKLWSFRGSFWFKMQTIWHFLFVSFWKNKNLFFKGLFLYNHKSNWKSQTLWFVALDESFPTRSCLFHSIHKTSSNLAIKFNPGRGKVKVMHLCISKYFYTFKSLHQMIRSGLDFPKNGASGLYLLLQFQTMATKDFNMRITKHPPPQVLTTLQLVFERGTTTPWIRWGGLLLWLLSLTCLDFFLAWVFPSFVNLTFRRRNVFLIHLLAQQESETQQVSRNLSFCLLPQQHDSTPLASVLLTDWLFQQSWGNSK